ncbi:ArsR/SmtB family transcription factor [Streptomyces sedi]|uniref:Winged helix-turn-helix transcriptional regulator n=1 Tax=Streptomyces sedi TaxID=555059 RepID=A0A5C4V4A1_9ACTN|nr:helix-turn-helix domain-containing protein [Streptomyces sedi]TNM30680.1 winged helix-turn-helix transcriptional regulator [Streptomyces sedi]
MLESVFAFDALVRRGGGGPFAEWRQRTLARMGPRARGLSGLPPALRSLPDLLAAAEADPLETAGRRDGVAAALREFRGVAVTPYWPRIAACLEADCSARGRLLQRGGVELLLSTLHPAVTWSSGGLRIDGRGPGGEARLDGRGLLLTPSLFLSGPPLLVDPPGRAAAPTLVYPVVLAPAEIAALWTENEECQVEALGALVGRTRAAIMQTLTDACNTTELGRRVGVSPAAASQHAAVLRSAGLITTHRRLNSALHTLTPLGMALLNAHTRAAGGRARHVN